ncbi:zonular occludens toxin domain-containing protein [Pseudoalteromonas sp. Of11M-6]|uniref:zonular occludens toxin domain-containing protein n=1 Tax=Pseudoalteromonas sp. Of11M-6 TaxID=2917754 RepID=UPI001EF651C8|nr:zonular occludens toxin domain-containing protein [Pseudoalteromonas sp. Of11M-6]MCG7553293.1 zonular occludens toxin domain-containing protein [Pseudoalteromonas sp. Of11M-6]
MIIFHEGLPGSGKSYEAIVKHIIPNLERGRKVYARLNGFNYDKVSELTGKTVDELKELYTEITEEQVTEVYKHVENDSLLVIDELQNFFPSGRQKLSDEMTKFIAEHRHKGMDIVCMGQALADCHTTWKRRVERKITFLKLSMVGLDKKYKWEMYQGIMSGEKSDVVFKKIKSGTDTYDPKYFGSYLSHQQDTNNKDVYQDDRVNLFKSKSFKLYLPFFIAIFAYAIYYLSSLFSGETQIVDDKSKQASEQTTPRTDTTSTETNTNQATPKPKRVNISSDPKQRMRELIQTNRAYVTYSEIYKGQIVELTLVVETESKQLIDRFNRNELLMLGYRLRNTEIGIEAYIGETLAAIFRYKPMGDIFNQIPDDAASKLYSE